MIAVSGISGEGRFAETIDVGKVKPSEANAALRYLWARHRITVLSDYNKLRASDKRIQEVTELGLRYNLLTAYTSFVAIDSEVRNTEGKPTTVKQPLPLPQGVSDYAVGGKMMHAYAPMAQMAKREALGTSEDRALVKEKRAKDEEKDRKTAVVIDDVAVSQGLSKEDVLKKLKEQTAKLDSCFAGAKGKLVLRLTISPDGTVKSVQVLSSTFKNGKAPQCVLDRTEKDQDVRHAGRERGEGGGHAVLGMILFSTIRPTLQAGAGVRSHARAPAWKFSLDKIAAGTGNRGNENT